MATSTEGDASSRARLAITIVSLSLIGVAIASAVAMIFATEANRPEMAPLDVRLCSPSTRHLGGDRPCFLLRTGEPAGRDGEHRTAGRTHPAAYSGVGGDDSQGADHLHDLLAGADARAVPLVELYNKMTTGKVGRIRSLVLLVLSFYVVHKATIDSFAGSLQPPMDPAALTETMGELLDKPDLKKAVEAISFVSPNAVVEEARAAPAFCGRVQ